MYIYIYIYMCVCVLLQVAKCVPLNVFLPFNLSSSIPFRFDLGHDLDLGFLRSNIEFAISQPKMVRLPRNEKQTYRLNSRPQLWPSVWPWPWPWPWIIKVKYGIYYISAKSGPIATKWKANTSIELQASNMINGFDLDHDLDLWILKARCDHDLWPHTWPWPWIFMVKFWNSCISQWEGWFLALHKGGGSRSCMTLTVTIWWPRSGVWIYQIVTGVTPIVGVPSTHLDYPCWDWT